MKDSPTRIGILLLVAALVWGWNLHRLAAPDGESAVDPALAPLPEIPGELRLEAPTLPDLIRDPFTDLPPTGQADTASANQLVYQQALGPAAPGGDLRMVMIRSGQTQALFANPDGSETLLEVGDMLAEWRVVRLDLAGMAIEHPAGAVHEYPLP